MPLLELTVARTSTPTGTPDEEGHRACLTSATGLFRGDRGTRLSIAQDVQHCKLQGVDRGFSYDGHRRPAYRRNTHAGSVCEASAQGSGSLGKARIVRWRPGWAVRRPRSRASERRGLQPDRVPVSWGQCRRLAEAKGLEKKSVCQARSLLHLPLASRLNIRDCIRSVRE